MSRRRRLFFAGLVVVAMTVVAYVLVPWTPEPPTERPIAVSLRTPDPPVTWPPPDDRVAQAVGHCQATWKSRAYTCCEPGNAQTLDAQADCGMVLVENARTTGTEARFRDAVDPITPVLYQALETARGARAADLLAHLGWADFLRWKDGLGGLRPEGFYRRAIEQDPDPVCQRLVGPLDPMAARSARRGAGALPPRAVERTGAGVRPHACRSWR